MVSGSGSDESNPAGGLDGLRQTVISANPELYRHLALYLQVLRNVLPGRTQQACFHLATQVHAQRYLSLSSERRLELQRLIQERVQLCCSLLTVEQLAALAGRLDQDHQEQQTRRQRTLLQRLLNHTDEQPEPDTDDSTDPGDGDPSGREAGGQPPPPGSVRLTLSPPLDQAALGWGMPPDWSASSSDWDRQSLADATTDQSAEAEDHAQADFDHSVHSSDPSEEPDPDDGEDADAEALMAALMQGLLANEAMFASSEAGGQSSQAGATGAAADQEARLAAASSQVPHGIDRPGTPMQRALQPGAAVSPWSDAALPSDPVLLLRWLDGLEQALVRRLRDLSHAINADLLRLGLSRGLLPVSLLEAAVRGQVETLSAPANVLRLQLPFGLRPGAPPLQAIAMLLRPADLEMEEPRLRTCRRRIHQHRQQVRKMAETYRRLQRRLQAHEAERLWLQDIRASHERGS